ncbi:type II toxin-antitoxin system death-on-curing family toxin [bacterium]|nr:type II toxin-antitoxin system death-on-curing family toxin [bacterium]
MCFRSDEIYFLTREDVLEIHRQCLMPEEPPEIIHEDLFDSALNQPQASFGGEFLHRNIFEMSAAYLISFSKDHVFMSANKRVALNACLIFLQMNNHRLLLTNDEAIDLTTKCVTGEYTKEKIIEIIRNNTA